MSPQEIKTRLAERKITQTEIARRCGVSFNTVHLVIHGKGTSARVEKRLARALGIKLEELRGKIPLVPSQN